MAVNKKDIKNATINNTTQIFDENGFRNTNQDVASSSIVLIKTSIVGKIYGGKGSNAKTLSLD